MTNGGGGQYDMVSSSGDADLRLIYAGDVRPVNINLIPCWKNFLPVLQARPLTPLTGCTTGSRSIGPQRPAVQRERLQAAPPSWSVIYNQKYKGQITVPDNPIQIADAALYLTKADPKLGITDPYELTQPQFNAAVTCSSSSR